VPPGDAEALADALRQWLTDAELRRRLRTSALNRRPGLAGWRETTRVIATVLGGAPLAGPVGSAAFPADWLALRESADAAARRTELLEPLAARLPGDDIVIRDLGCGTGSMGRWLAPRLPGAQRWILHDHDAGLLRRAVEDLPRTARDGSRVTAEARVGSVARLRGADLAGTHLVTASALLDLFTRDEVGALAAACAAADCPALLALSVAGHVELSPADPLDDEIADAFNAHQRRAVEGRTLLGPDAAEAATEAFERLGYTVQVRPSPWRLTPDQSELTREWLHGWVAAACEQRPELAARAEGYLRHRLRELAAGELHVVVDHRDVLALPTGAT
jgi:hypothetical protein